MGAKASAPYTFKKKRKTFRVYLHRCIIIYSRAHARTHTIGDGLNTLVNAPVMYNYTAHAHVYIRAQCCTVLCKSTRVHVCVIYKLDLSFVQRLSSSPIAFSSASHHHSANAYYYYARTPLCILFYTAFY